MIYSEKHNFLFVSVPKTGTTSIQSKLVEAGVGIQNRLEMDGELVRVPDHMTALELKEYFGTRWDQLHKVAFSRNPWDKYYSAYLYNKQGLVQRYGHDPKLTKHFHLKVALSKYVPFAIWAIFYPTRPCSHFICDEKGAVLVDKVYSFENLDAAFADICGSLKLETTQVPKKNVSQRDAAYTELFGACSRWIVKMRQRVDLRNFGYRFNVSQDQIIVSPKSSD